MGLVDRLRVAANEADEMVQMLVALGNEKGVTEAVLGRPCTPKQARSECSQAIREAADELERLQLRERRGMQLLLWVVERLRAKLDDAVARNSEHPDDRYLCGLVDAYTLALIDAREASQRSVTAE